MKKRYFLLALFILFLLPNVAFAESVKVRMGGPMGNNIIATIPAERNVTTLGDIKAILISDYNIDFTQYVIADGSLTVIDESELICGAKLGCYGPLGDEHTTIDLAPIDNTRREFTLDSVPPKNANEAQSIFEVYWEVFDDIYYKSCNSTFTVCTFANGGEFKLYNNVNIIYNYDNDIKTLAETIISAGLLNKTSFNATDTEVLHHINYGGALSSYASEFKNQLANSNFEFDIDTRAGFADPFAIGEAGFSKFLYEGTIYAVKDFVEVIGDQTIYVPSDATDILEAIRARFTAMFGDDNHLTVTESTDNINDLLDNAGEPTIADGDKHYYIITNTVTDMEYFFKAVKDSSKVNNDPPQFKSSDLFTNVSVETDGNLPLDTVVRVQELKNGATYDSIFETLNINDGEVYDITLYSHSQNKQVTSLPNGKFLVSLPVPDRMAGKTLIVYYVTTSNTVEEHVVTPKTVNGETMATFETDHFSVYTLALNPTQQTAPLATTNPQTSDNIMLSVIGLFVCIIIVSGLLVVYQHNKKEIKIMYNKD